MSAGAAIVCLVVLGLMIVVGQWLFGILGIKAIDLLWPSEEWRFHRDYETRNPLSDEQIIREYFAESKIDPQIPLGLRRIFGPQFQLDPERIRPFDDFAAIYADLDFAELFDEIEEEFDVAFSDDEWIEINGTISALADLIQRKRTPDGGSVA